MHANTEKPKTDVQILVVINDDKLDFGKFDGDYLHFYDDTFLLSSIKGWFYMDEVKKSLYLQ